MRQFFHAPIIAGGEQRADVGGEFRHAKLDRKIALEHRALVHSMKCVQQMKIVRSEDDLVDSDQFARAVRR